MRIKSIRGLQNYIKRHSYFSGRTVNSVIFALGYHPQHHTKDEFKELSGIFNDCSKYGAAIGFSGFIYYADTISFFKKNRNDIINHMEQTAAELGTDIISMVQSFGVFRNSEKPTASEIGKALWGNRHHQDLTSLYNVFAWYALEEVSRTWCRYLEDNPAYSAELSA
ncbi:MAG: hypothetical protein LBC80_04955 [Treponema sp.]|jgi:hypothetical protein|nr:hypothetical protein [Treponema sp.]